MARTNEWTEETKVCSRCGKTKPLSEFHKRAASKDGASPWCKQCNLDYKREYRKKHREEEIVKQREYYYENREQHADRRLQRIYDISLADYDEMLEAQGSGCAICGKTPEENGRRLSVDHDHETGEVRGLLCTDCNVSLGRFNDSSEVCRQAMLYLRSYGR
jgi:hypothetical protein